MADTPPERLDSWKAIALYLNRDQRTVRRWEREQGLPIHRVPGGRGTSVFAYASEIEAWLKTTSTGSEIPELATPAATPGLPQRGQSGFRWVPVAAAVLLIGSAITVVWAMAAHLEPIRASELRLDVTQAGVTGFDAAGRARWRYAFPPAYLTSVTDPGHSWLVVGGTHPAALVADTDRIRKSDGVAESGALTSFTLDGRVERTFSFSDSVTFGGKLFGPPWGMNAFAVNNTGGTRRIAVAGHHFVWNPSLVTVLDDQWKRHGTFVHDGWIESVTWVTPHRLLVGGFSNAHDGGMLALLDADALDGQGPEAPGTAAYCDTCGRDMPLRMVIMPRTELNRATASPFNHAMVQIAGGVVFARTIEAVPEDASAADALYEFTTSLDVIGASYSDRYRELRHALEAQGKLSPTSDAATNRDWPRDIQVWDRATGWKTVVIPAALRR